jgi:hypothetical protein
MMQVEYIPQAKIASLFVVFGLVIVCKYLERSYNAFPGRMNLDIKSLAGQYHNIFLVPLLFRDVLLFTQITNY